MKLTSCSDGCLDEGNLNGVPSYEKLLIRSRWIMDETLIDEQITDYGEYFDLTKFYILSM